MKIKIFVLSMLLVSCEPALASLCGALAEQRLSLSQQMVLKYSFELGRQENLSYSLAAIAWQESSAGRTVINRNDPSYGIHQIHMSNAIQYSGLLDTPSNRQLVAIHLVNSHKLSAEYAILNIRGWQRSYGYDWTKIWASYNAGWNYRAGLKYAEDIKTKIDIIRQCNW